MPAMINHPLNEIQDEMERLFSAMPKDFGFPAVIPQEWRLFKRENGPVKTWFPPVEILESDTEYTIKAEVPGLPPEDIHVEVMGETVTIQGETCLEKCGTEHSIHRSEFRYGKFYRRIPLPSNVVPEQAQAEFKNGILELRLPKLEKDQRKRIKIQVKAKS